MAFEVKLNSKFDWRKYDSGMFSIWYCNCYGINILMCAGDIEEDGNVRLYELKTAKYKDGVRLCYDGRNKCFKGAEKYKRLIAPLNESNCFTKAPLLATPSINKKGEIRLIYNIEIGSRLYYNIKRLGIFKEENLSSLKVKFIKIGNLQNYDELIMTYWPMQKQLVVNEDDVFLA